MVKICILWVVLDRVVIMYCCEVDSLLSNSLNHYNQQLAVIENYFYPVSFGQQLITINYGSSIFAHSLTAQSWVQVGNGPCTELGASPVVLRTGELLVVEHNPCEVKSKVFKASLKGRILFQFLSLGCTVSCTVPKK